MISVLGYCGEWLDPIVWYVGMILVIFHNGGSRAPKVDRLEGEYGVVDEFLDLGTVSQAGSAMMDSQSNWTANMQLL